MILSIRKILTGLDSLMAAKTPRQPVTMAELGLAFNINPNDQLLLFYFMRDAKLLSINRVGSSISLPPEMKYDTVRFLPDAMAFLFGAAPDRTIDLSLYSPSISEKVAKIYLSRKRKNPILANVRPKVGTEP